MAVEYIAENGALVVAEPTLLPHQVEELKQHLAGCEVALQDCRDCWLLYINIGHEAYARALAGVTGGDDDDVE